MVRKILAVAVVAGALALSACNTVSGAGKDVSSAGKAVSNAADDAK
jgi:predicted small secreted protein